MHYTLSEINDQINELNKHIKYLDTLLVGRISDDQKKIWDTFDQNHSRFKSISYQINNNLKNIDTYNQHIEFRRNSKVLKDYGYLSWFHLVDRYLYPWIRNKKYINSFECDIFTEFKIEPSKFNKNELFKIFLNAKFFALLDLFYSEKKLKDLEKAKEIQGSRNKKFETKIERGEALVEKHRAFSYAHQEKTRDLADDLKPRVQREQIKIIGEICPYCQQSIGADHHLDHIHPVSKGGLSKKENLILVCKKCNIKKSDQTLRNFIKNFNLDEHKISTNLELLGKDW